MGLLFLGDFFAGGWAVQLEAREEVVLSLERSLCQESAGRQLVTKSSVSISLRFLISETRKIIAFSHQGSRTVNAEGMHQGCSSGMANLGWLQRTQFEE